MKKGNCSKLLMILMIVCVTLSVAILAIMCYDRFIKKEKKETIPAPIVQTSGNYSVNVAELKTEFEKINSELKETFKNTTKEEFSAKAEKYLTSEMIQKLVQFYNEDAKGICLDVGGCNVDGGYFNDTDINYRNLEVKTVTHDTCVVDGIYGESIDNTKKTEITYKKVNGTWKISDFNINA